MSRLRTYRRRPDFRARNVPVPYDSFIFSEDFSSDPFSVPTWEKFGSGTKTWDGSIQHKTATTAGGSDGSGYDPVNLERSFPPQREVWCKFDIWVENISGLGTAEDTTGTGLTEFSGGNPVAGNIFGLGVQNDAGTNKWNLHPQQNPGGTDIAIDDPAFVEGEKVECVMHMRKASASGANNGITQAWLWDTLVYNQSDRNTDALTISGFVVGNMNSAGSPFTMDIFNDNILVRTTKEIPRNAAPALGGPPAGTLPMMGMGV